MSNPLGQKNSLSFSHMGFYVRDLERMARFYKEVMCFFETDRGDLGPVQLVFLSRDPCEHHQIVLATFIIGQNAWRAEVVKAICKDQRRALRQFWQVHPAVIFGDVDQTFDTVPQKRLDQWRDPVGASIGIGDHQRHATL